MCMELHTFSKQLGSSPVTFMAIACDPLSTAMHHLLFTCLILFLSCCVRNTESVSGAGVTREGFRTTTVSSLLPKERCSRPARGGSRGLPITPRYGPCSKTGRAQPPAKEISGLETSFSLDKSKVKFEEDDGSFLVDVAFGNSTGKKYHLLLDTGSHVTWVQCTPCGKCFKNASSFDPAASATYSPGSCIPNGDTTYAILYADKSSSKGKYGCDTLTLDPPDVFPKFQFGCGIDNQGDFGEGVDGVLGLGRGPLSLLSQTASKYKNVFSYCLPEDTTGSLLFGDAAMSQSSSLHFTSLVNPGSPDYYYVELLGISVANKRLDIPTSIFTDSGTIVDSGTAVTRLPQTAYSALKAAFKEAMSNYTLSKTKPTGGNILDTCYDLKGTKVLLLPQIVLHFGGEADLVLNGKSIIWGKNPSNMCLAFAESTEKSIIGSRQQLSHTVLYDIPGERIGFGNTGCAR